MALVAEKRTFVASCLFFKQQSHNPNKGVCVEACPTSNLLTKAIPSRHSHPAKKFLESGIRLTLATDGVLMTDTSLSREYFLAHTEGGLSRAQLVEALCNGFLAAFSPDAAELAAAARVEASHALLQ